MAGLVASWLHQQHLLLRARPTDGPPASPGYAALLALLNAVLAALSAFHIWGASPTQTVALVALYTSLFVVAGLVAEWLRQARWVAALRRP
jgi:hypothetical protein